MLDCFGITACGKKAKRKHRGEYKSQTTAKATRKSVRRQTSFCFVFPSVKNRQQAIASSSSDMFVYYELVFDPEKFYEISSLTFEYWPAFFVFAVWLITTNCTAKPVIYIYMYIYTIWFENQQP